MTPSPSRTLAVRCLAAALLLVWAGLTASPAAAEGKVTVTGPEKSATVELDADSARPGRFRGRVHVVVSAGEAGKAGATGSTGSPLAVGAFLDADGDASDACTKPGAVQASLAAPVSLTSNVAAGAVVDLNLAKECVDRAGTLVFSTQGSTPATLRFTLVRGVENTPEYENALLAAFWATLLAFPLMVVRGSWFGDVRRGWLSVELPIEAPFGVKDSWLTTVASVGTLLGTVLGASHVLTEWLPGISTARFLGLNLFFGALILFAPVIYATSCSWRMSPLEPEPTADTEKDKDKDESKRRRWWHLGCPDAPTTPPKPVERQFKAVGHGWGLVASASTTLAGVFGQLATLLVMVVSADGTLLIKWILGVCLCAAACFVALYAVRFVRGVLGAACDAAADAAARGQTPPTSQELPTRTYTRTTAAL
ncbi:hypothetical protein ACFY7C_27095 [Streptomyces sp. NPDC012769]|uniref:hypothetical protein n=1 Tax=Streptomyces sp. NPDC012769 TaxID=3364848 RepID=UPI00367E426D